MDGNEPICPAKQTSAPKVIVFGDLSDLQRKLHGFSIDPEPKVTISSQHSAALVQPDEQTPSASDDSPPGSKPATTGTEDKADGQTLAAIRIQLGWRRYCARRYLMQTSKLSQEGLCYERFRLSFIKLTAGLLKADNLLQKILRGPCLSIILAVDVVGDELQELLGKTTERLDEPGLDVDAIRDIQRRQKLTE